jgi:hypothetical protein
MSEPEKPAEPNIGQLSGRATMTFTASGTLKGFQGPQRLLDTAERLFAGGEYDVAVIVAQTACEVVAERLLGKDYPVDRSKKWVPTYSLDTERRLKQYKKLTKDVGIDDKTGFWPQYQKLAQMRHEAVHQGVVCNKESTREGLDAARKLVERVAKYIVEDKAMSKKKPEAIDKMRQLAG